ncbi:MAG: YraN family protein [Proteobacteria bacterium]|nr:YraN family protein [Candidatus Enterousia scatequi]
MHSKRNTYFTGLGAEFRARWFLRFHGYRILESRYITGRNTGRAEIDVIAKRANTIVFIEVKYRPDLRTAWDAISVHQAIRLRRAAENYLAKKRWRGDARFDVIAVCGHKIYWAKNAI